MVAAHAAAHLVTRFLIIPNLLNQLAAIPQALPRLFGVYLVPGFSPCQKIAQFRFWDSGNLRESALGAVSFNNFTFKLKRHTLFTSLYILL
jgi:hypothetical protein